jgi:hypothetical protein
VEVAGKKVNEKLSLVLIISSYIILFRSVLHVIYLRKNIPVWNEKELSPTFDRNVQNTRETKKLKLILIYLKSDIGNIDEDGEYERYELSFIYTCVFVL